MNRIAQIALEQAQTLYLLANGWVALDRDRWQEPPDGYGGGRTLTFGHAVNSQLYHDRKWAPPRPPETREERHARWRQGIASAWRGRHHERAERQHIRQMIRWLARETPAETRVQKARLRRAEHARHHKAKGCSCGKEGVPY